MADRWYEVTFIIDGYITLRVLAENEDDAEELAGIELHKALESEGFWKYELDYPDGPFIEALDVNWQGAQAKEVKEAK